MKVSSKDSLPESALQSLRADWAKVKGAPEKSINWNTTQVNLEEFTKLMNPEMKPKDVEALFNLYDFNHDGSIAWKEYIVVITLIMSGSVKQKIQLIFNCFDEDGNGELSKKEFVTAASRFSQSQSQGIEQFATKIFASCDKNGDGSVSYKEFYNWVQANPAEFEKFAGVLNIVHMTEED